MNRPAEEPGFRLDAPKRPPAALSATRLISYAVDRAPPEGERYEPTGATSRGHGHSTTARLNGEPTTVPSTTQGRERRGRGQPRLRRSTSRASTSEAGIGEVLDSLDRDLVGLAPVKRRVREIAALLLVERVRERVGLSAGPPSLHMCFTGNPGTGKTTVAMRMAEILHRLGYVRKGHVVAVTRDDLVGQYIGHTAPKTKDVLKKAMGGVLFIDEAYYLYRPENEKDYGQEAIEILLQVMENQRDDLVVILAGYEDRMDTFFETQPRHGVAHRAPRRVPRLHATTSSSTSPRRCSPSGTTASTTSAARGVPRVPARSAATRPHFANARSVRNALDRIRLRQALRLFEERGPRSSPPRTCRSIREPEVRASRLFDGRRDEDADEPTPRHGGSRRDDACAAQYRATLTQYLIEQRRQHPDATGEFNELILGVAQACKAIARAVAHGALAGVRGRLGRDQRPGRGAEGARRASPTTSSCRPPSGTGVLSGMASEEMDDVRSAHPGRVPARQVPARLRPARRLEQHRRQRRRSARIFSILRAPDPASDPAEADFLQPGTEQVAAGYAIYGPSTMLVLTVGDGVVGFTLDPALGEFVLTHPDIRVPETTCEFAINASNSRFWEPPVQALRRGVPGRADGPARQGLQHALDRVARRRGPPHPHARRRLPLPARHQGPDASRVGCACSTSATPSA